MSIRNGAWSSRIAAAVLVGLTWLVANCPAAEDQVAQRQRQLRNTLQHILVPYLGTEPRPARRYASPRPWRSALAKHTAGMLNGANSPQAAAWFLDEKNLIVGEGKQVVSVDVDHRVRWRHR